MLQNIHDKMHGWVAYLVLGAVAASFIFWGINWTLAAPEYAAKVNGSEIPVGEVRQSYQTQILQEQRRSGGTVDDLQREAIKRQVLDEYVNSEAVLTHLQSLGYRVGRDDLLKAMAQIPAFQVDGKFDPAHAVAILKAQGRSVAEIEGLVRRQVQLEQLDLAMRASSFATPSESKRLDALMREQRELAWIVVPAAHFAETVKVDEAAVKAYYEAHKSAYMTPETVDLHYVEIDVAQLAAKLAVSDAQLQAYFEEQKTKSPDTYTQAEKRQVSHILIQVADPKDDAAAKAKAEGIQKRIEAGEDFGKLAKEFSQDPGSGQQGGDLGWSERKAWVPAFADAAFSMKVGEVRGPVKTQFGYHILKLNGIQDASTKTFEQSRSDLEAEYRRGEAERRFNDLQDQLADAALQSSTDIDAVARKAGLPVEQIAGFSRSEGGGALGKSPQAIEAAFSADALDGRVSPIVALDKGRGIVLKASNHRLPQQEPLEAVHEAVVAAWRQQRGQELGAEAAADAVRRLEAGESWESVDKALGAALQAPRFVARGEAAVPVDIRRAAFELPKPAGKPEYRSVSLPDGDTAVFGLSAVREDPTVNPQEQAFAKRQYAQQFAAAESQSYALSVRAAAKIVVNPKAIE